MNNLNDTNLPAEGQQDGWKRYVEELRRKLAHGNALTPDEMNALGSARTGWFATAQSQPAAYGQYDFGQSRTSEGSGLSSSAPSGRAESVLQPETGKRPLSSRDVRLANNAASFSYGRRRSQNSEPYEAPVSNYDTKPNMAAYQTPKFTPKVPDTTRKMY